MKVHYIDKKNKTGVLTIVDSMGREADFSFPLETIFDWYPCCLSYSYNYSTREQRLYLVLEDRSDIRKVHYGMSQTNKRSISEIASMKYGEWCSKEVKEENEKMFDFARIYGIITPDEEFTLKEVEDSISRVQDIFDMLYTFSYKDLLNRGIEGKLSDKETEQLSRIDNYEKEGKARFILSRASETTKDRYEQFGEVLNMLFIMRKMVA